MSFTSVGAVGDHLSLAIDPFWFTDPVLCFRFPPVSAWHWWHSWFVMQRVFRPVRSPRAMAAKWEVSCRHLSAEPSVGLMANVLAGTVSGDHACCALPAYRFGGSGVSRLLLMPTSVLLSAIITCARCRLPIPYHGRTPYRLRKGDRLFTTPRQSTDSAIRR